MSCFAASPLCQGTAGLFQLWYCPLTTGVWPHCLSFSQPWEKTLLVSGARYLIGQVGRRLDSKNSSSDLPGGEMCISVFPSVHVVFTSAFLGEETSLASPSFHLQGVYYSKVCTIATIHSLSRYYTFLNFSGHCLCYEWGIMLFLRTFLLFFSFCSSYHWNGLNRHMLQSWCDS